MKLLYGIAVDGKQVPAFFDFAVDNFCIDGKFHIGISHDLTDDG